MLLLLGLRIGVGSEIYFFVLVLGSLKTNYLNRTKHLLLLEPVKEPLVIKDGCLLFITLSLQLFLELNDAALGEFLKIVEKTCK